MSGWDRVNQIRREEEKTREEEKERVREQHEREHREAMELGQRAQRMLDESDVVRALQEIRQGIYLHTFQRHVELSVDQFGRGVELDWGSSDRSYSRIRVSADPSTDSIIVEGRTIRTIPASVWRESSGAIEDAVAEAYLNPGGVELGPPRSYSIGEASHEGRNQECCHCLSRSSLISTPIGDIKVENLKTGDLVWTNNSNGKRVKSKIIKVTKIPIHNEHQMLKITMIDNKTVTVSPEHPDKNGVPLIKALKELRLNGLKIKNVELIGYKNKFTYDILPEGETGNYWVNGVLLGSTLASNFQHDFCPHYKSA